MTMTQEGGGRCCDHDQEGEGRCCDHVPGGEGGVVTRSLVHSSPPGDRMTNICENITFARFATRAVTNNEQCSQSLLICKSDAARTQISTEKL